MAKQLDQDAVRMAVVAHIRHAETEYDGLLARGCERWEARGLVAEDVERALAAWQEPVA